MEQHCDWIVHGTVGVRGKGCSRTGMRPKLHLQAADWQVKPHCRPSEVANGPWADAAGSMRRGWPRPRGVAGIVYRNRGVFDKSGAAQRLPAVRGYATALEKGPFQAEMPSNGGPEYDRYNATSESATQ